MSQPNPDSEASAVWARLSRGLAALGDRMEREIAECARLAAAAVSTPHPAEDPQLPSGDLESTPGDFVARRAQVADAWLLGPLGRVEEREILRRVLAAFEAYRTGLTELVRRTPEEIRVRGPDLAAVVRPVTGSGALSRFLPGWRGERTVRLRSALSKALVQVEARQEVIESRFGMELVAALDDLHTLWRQRRDEFEGGEPGVTVQDPGPRIVACTDRFRRELRGQVPAALPTLARAVVASFFLGRLGTRKTVRGPSGRRHIEYWTAHFGSVQREARFERDLFEAEQRMLTAGIAACANLEDERGHLLGALNELERWVDGRLAGMSDGVPSPEGVAEVVPAISRTSSLTRAFRDIMTSLPESLTVLSDPGELSTRRPRRKVLQPVRLAAEGFDSVCLSGLERLFQAAEEDHLATLHEIDHAVQVVEYGASVPDGSDPVEGSVEREALENGRALLQSERTALEAPRSDSGTMLRLLLRFFQHYRVLLRRSRLGALAHLGTLDVRHAVGMAIAGTATWVLSLVRRGVMAVPRTFRAFLIAIKWAPPLDESAGGVTRRPYLPKEFTLDVRTRELPGIYRRLFRLEAVEDPRFLIGRETELAAFGEARSVWEAGRPVALLVVGARGSGKTSLINCALQRSLSGLEVCRGEFTHRVVTPSEVRATIAKIIGIEAPDRIEEELNEHGRVVVLEELERAFLREIGSFAGVRELQRLIAATCGTTLWIIACNQRAFQLLNRVLALADSFSHRIDAASVPEDVLRQAILVRHNLSGLRLRFLPQGGPASLGERMAARLGRRGSPETAFFLRLAEESGGVFRTAFELWLGEVVQARSGTLDLRPVGRPEIADIIAELDQDDLFTILATMQHGSLTADEHARVFHQTLAASQAEMDELLARELIESDPVREGFRVRPSANRVAREALHRSNLA